MIYRLLYIGYSDFAVMTKRSMDIKVGNKLNATLIAEMAGTKHMPGTRVVNC